MIARISVWLVLLVGLSSCATLKKSFCDCDCSGEMNEKKKVSQQVSVKPVKATKTIAKGKVGVTVDENDIAAADKMTKAVDAYVFNNQPEEFTQLCREDRFDCYVNEKRFPKDKKKIKRTVPPFLSGSKMGLQGDKRVKIKYDFYP